METFYFSIFASLLHLAFPQGQDPIWFSSADVFHVNLILEAAGRSFEGWRKGSDWQKQTLHSLDLAEISLMVPRFQSEVGAPPLLKALPL